MKQKLRPAFCAASVGLAVLVWGSPVHAQTPVPVVSQKAERAIKELQDPPYFAIGGVGIAGQISEGEKALVVLLQEKNAVPLLQTLLKTAKPTGQLYALVGLQATVGSQADLIPAGHANEHQVKTIKPKVGERADFTAAIAPFRNRKDFVQTFSGCIGTRQTVGGIVALIEKGRYVLRTAAPVPPPSKN